jgi:hypothetical protein
MVKAGTPRSCAHQYFRPAALSTASFAAYARWLFVAGGPVAHLLALAERAEQRGLHRASRSASAAGTWQALERHERLVGVEARVLIACTSLVSPTPTSKTVRSESSSSSSAGNRRSCFCVAPCGRAWRDAAPSLPLPPAELVLSAPDAEAQVCRKWKSTTRLRAAICTRSTGCGAPPLGARLRVHPHRAQHLAGRVGEVAVALGDVTPDLPHRLAQLLARP